jgi:hypothetical protein
MLKFNDSFQKKLEKNIVDVYKQYGKIDNVIPEKMALSISKYIDFVPLVKYKIDNNKVFIENDDILVHFAKKDR